MVTGGYNDEGLANAEPLTQNQIEWGQRIVSFCAEWGIPIRLYDGPRFGAGGWSGWVNHHDLDKDRYDGLLRDEWMKIASSSPVPTPPKKRKIPMAIAAGIEGVPYRAFIVEGGVIQAECRGPGQPPYGLPEEAMNAISAGALGKQYTRFEFDTLILRTQSVSGGRLVPGVDLLTFKQP
jgi:hypothetical protein